MKETGLIQIYTGGGKGKSTAAFGLSLRAAGWGLRTAIVQFMKNGEGYGEIKAFTAQPLIDVYSFGGNKWFTKGESLQDEDLNCVREAMGKTEELMADRSVDLLILDEFFNAIYFDLVSERDALILISSKRPDQELVLTGRNASQTFLDLADLVTEMKELKHPYQKGVQARRGIEY